MRDNKISVVILTYNKWELTEQLVKDLEKHEKENIDEILVVDNGSTEGRVFDNPFDCLVYERIEENIGFTLGFNHGLKLATGEIAEKKAIFAISNDVRIHGVFIQQATDLLFGARRCLVGNDHLAFDTGWNKFNGVTYDYLAGHFLAATSDGWRELGYFDERFAPNDYEDVDLSTTAKKKGYKLVALNNPNIVHAGGGTYGYTPERRLQTERNREVFKSKWVK